MTDRELMQMALDALEAQFYTDGRTIKALRDRLAQPEPEPVAWFTEDHREDKSATTYSKKMAERWREKGWPVTPLYTAPPRKEWVGLTDDDYEQLLEVREWGVYLIEAVEQKLKEKNT